MSERALISLAQGWALGADSRQWILYQVSAACIWPIHFIATHQRIIERLIREEGIDLSPEGRAAIDALPDHFGKPRQRAG